MLETVVIAAPVDAFADGTSDQVWIEALPAKTYHTSYYGEVPVTDTKLQRMVRNFKENVRGQEIAVDFDHGMDRAKGNKAAGWYRDFKIAPSTADANAAALWALVEFTEEARSEIKDRQWRYFSLEWEDEWMNNDGAKFEDVVTGGGITNKPIAKNTMPINFSESMFKELDDEQKKAFSVAMITKDMSAEEKAAFDLLSSSGNGYEITKPSNESKEWEHSEPGTGTPPQPRTDEDGSDDIAIKEGWRRETPPIAVDALDKSKEGGSKVSEFVFAEKDARELLHALDLDTTTEPAKVVETIKVKFGELDSLRRAADAVTQEKAFAEQYPQYWDEHRKLMERDRTNTAKNFSESVSKVRKAEGYGLKETKQGLSTLAVEKIEEAHRKFSEGEGTIELFEEVVKTIMNGGILNFGEIGHSNNGEESDIPNVDTTTAAGVANARKVFGEVVAKIQREHPEMSYTDVLSEAGKKHPDLAEAYKVTLPA